MSWVELKKIEFESKEPAVKCEDRKYTVVFLRIPLQNETVDYLIKSSSILYKVGILQPACDIKMKWQLVFLYPKLSKTMKSLLHFLDKITPRPLTSTFQYRTSEEDQERAGINFARSPLRSQRTQVINSNTWQLPLCFPHSRGGCCPNQMSSAPPPPCTSRGQCSDDIATEDRLKHLSFEASRGLLAAPIEQQRKTLGRLPKDRWRNF